MKRSDLIGISCVLRAASTAAAVAGLLLAAAPALAQARSGAAKKPSQELTVQIKSGPGAGVYPAPASGTVCTRGFSRPGGWDIMASDPNGKLSIQVSADLPANGGSTDRLTVVWSVGVMNVQTGENPPRTIVTVDGQREGSARLTIQRTGRTATIALAGRTSTGEQILASLRCGQLIES